MIQLLTRRVLFSAGGTISAVVCTLHVYSVLVCCVPHIHIHVVYVCGAQQTYTLYTTRVTVYYTAVHHTHTQSVYMCGVQQTNTQWSSNHYKTVSTPPGV